MAITKEEVHKLAQLARLTVKPDEEERYAETISAVLEYMTILNEVDTTGVEETAQVTGLHNVVRADEVKPSPLADALVQAMPKTEGRRMVVPGVFEDSIS